MGCQPASYKAVEPVSSSLGVIWNFLHFDLQYFRIILELFCLALLSIVTIKHYNQKQLERRRVYFTLHFGVQREVKERQEPKQARDLGPGTDVETMEKH